MNKSFDEIKEKLTEFSLLLDVFKSEAVQVKVIEKLLDEYFDEGRSKSQFGYSLNGGDDQFARRGRPRKEVLTAEERDEKNRNNRALGATKVLTQLFEDGYFESKRQIGDIIRHSWEKLNSDVKATEVSGLLLRFVKEGKLDRDKNADNNRFEYFNANGTYARKNNEQEVAAG